MNRIFQYYPCPQPRPTGRRFPTDDGWGGRGTAHALLRAGKAGGLLIRIVADANM